MKTMIKKTIASLMAMATVTTCASALVSAEEANAIDISYKTLEESIVANDGTTIPAGAVAVDVSISGNIGMSGTALTFDVNSEVIKDSDGMPIVESGNIFNDVVTAGAQNGNKVVISEVGGEISNSNGKLFTFYISEPSKVSVTNIETTLPTIDDGIATCAVYDRDIAYGDVNVDGYVDMTDASDIMSAITKSRNKHKGTRILVVSEIKNDFASLFPRLPIVQLADGNGDGFIMDLLDEDGNSIPKYSEPKQILKYYAETAAGLIYNEPGWSLGVIGYYAQ